MIVLRKLCLNSLVNIATIRVFNIASGHEQVYLTHRHEGLTFQCDQCKLSISTIQSLKRRKINNIYWYHDVTLGRILRQLWVNIEAFRGFLKQNGQKLNNIYIRKHILRQIIIKFWAKRFRLLSSFLT